MASTISVRIVTAQSPIECLVGLNASDVDGNRMLDIREYEDMLVSFAKRDYHGCMPVTATNATVVNLIVENFNEASCLCNQYTAVGTFNPPCTCSFGTTGKVAVPGIYPSGYTDTVCRFIVTLLTMLCPLSVTKTPAPSPIQLPFTIPPAPTAVLSIAGGGSDGNGATIQPTKSLNHSLSDNTKQPQEDGSNSSGNNKSNTIAIVAVVLGLVGTSAVAGALYVCYRGKRRTIKQEAKVYDLGWNLTSSSSGSLVPNNQARPHEIVDETETSMEEGLNLNRENEAWALEQRDSASRTDLSKWALQGFDGGSVGGDRSVYSSSDQHNYHHWSAEDCSIEVISIAERPNMVDELSANTGQYGTYLYESDRIGPIDIDDGAVVETISAAPKITRINVTAPDKKTQSVKSDVTLEVTSKRSSTTEELFLANTCMGDDETYDRDRIGPIDIDNGVVVVTIPISTKVTSSDPTILVKKKHCKKLDITPRVNATPKSSRTVYKSKAQFRQASMLKPIPEARLTKAKKFTI